ncbi:GNAT family N-acetyltransferase [Clostridium hydrogenum]|uniref:GNAT family N-acetyltransferase n=1 Tax=Clostridium hydrogenum TaxID=2855764 RepID=UPI001F1ECA67|nr:GNAT family N-acetyltransferase [Clostridium hydrogenum]
MILKTKRLLLFPLTGRQLELLITDIVEFEKETTYRYSGEPLEGEMYDIIKGQIKPVQVSGEDFVWHTFWMIVLKNDNTIIGSICYKDIPSSNGSVEIGYGVSQEYESRGYTTEAVRAMIGWAFRQSNVLRIIAEVDKNNIASQKILCRNGFREFKSINNFNWYTISKTV